jgi:hypothetical protein
MVSDAASVATFETKGLENMSTEIQSQSPATACIPSQEDCLDFGTIAGGDVKTWEDPVILPYGNAPSAGCASGDNYYVQCDCGDKQGGV